MPSAVQAQQGAAWEVHLLFTSLNGVCRGSMGCVVLKLLGDLCTRDAWLLRPCVAAVSYVPCCSAVSGAAPFGRQHSHAGHGRWLAHAYEIECNPSESRRKGHTPHRTCHKLCHHGTMLHCNTRSAWTLPSPPCHTSNPLSLQACLMVWMPSRAMHHCCTSWQQQH